PGVVGQRVHGVGGNVFDSFIEAAAEFLDKVADQQRHIFPALAQRGNLNGKNVEAVVQIAAKSALGDQLGKVAVGGGHHANVDALRAVAAQALEFLLLEHAKQFWLQLERNIGNFVEKKGATVGQLEAADFLADGTGEGAAFVAEEFRFEKAGGNCGAIDFN